MKGCYCNTTIQGGWMGERCLRAVVAVITAAELYIKKGTQRQQSVAAMSIICRGSLWTLQIEEPTIKLLAITSQLYRLNRWFVRSSLHGSLCQSLCQKWWRHGTVCHVAGDAFRVMTWHDMSFDKLWVIYSGGRAQVLSQSSSNEGPLPR